MSIEVAAALGSAIGGLISFFLGYSVGRMAKYEPRWRFDRRRRAVVADEKFFYAMADTAERLKAENAKLREACAELLKMVERYDPEWLHWPEMHDELRELGVEVVSV